MHDKVQQWLYFRFVLTTSCYFIKKTSMKKNKIVSIFFTKTEAVTCSNSTKTHLKLLTTY